MSIKVDNVQYEKLLHEIMKKVGFSEEDAKITADVMITNDKLGIKTHGSFHIKTYIKKIIEGGINASGNVEVVREGPTWAIVDAQDSLGMVAGWKAMELAIQKSSQIGMTYVGVVNSSHFGSCARFGLMAAEKGKIALIMTNTFKNMSVPGGRGKIIGNAPIGYAIPAGRHYPVIFDVATSEVALTKVLRAAANDEKIPKGWISDEKGLTTSDPKAPNYSLLPFAGHKGYGFAFFIEVMTGILSGGAFLSQVGQDWMTNYSAKSCVSHGFVLLDVSLILGEETFKERMDQAIEEIHNSQLAEGSNKIFLPGEMEMLNKTRAEKEGLLLDDVVINNVKDVCEMLDVKISDFINI